MKGVSIITLLALLFVSCFASSRAMNPFPEKVFYISPTGDDENAGTKDHPFATLERAILAIRENPGGPVTIYLREGYYPLHRTIVLQDSDSTPDCPLSIRAYAREEAHVIGGREIAGFEALNPHTHNYNAITPEFRDHIMTIDLKARGITEFGKLSARGFGRAIQPSGLELYFNGKPMNLAR